MTGRAPVARPANHSFLSSGIFMVLSTRPCLRLFLLPVLFSLPWLLPWDILASPTPLPPDQGPADLISARSTTARTPAIRAVYRQLFQAAYAKAPEIRIARDTVREKKALQYSAWAKRLAPSVNGRLSQVHAFNSPDPLISDATDSSGSVYQDGQDYQDWGLTLDLPLYRRPVSLQVEIADKDLRLAENTLAMKTQELDLQLRDLLGNYMIAAYQLLNLRNSVLISREHVEKIRQGYELHDQTRLQLLRAEANLKELEARRDLYVQQKEAARRELLDYTGLQEDDPVMESLNRLLAEEESTAGCINVLADLEKTYQTVRPYIEENDPQQLRQLFMTHSILRRQVRLERDLAVARALLNTQNEWPGLTLRGLYDRSPDTRFEDFEGEGSLAVVLSVPLFSGGTIFSNIRARAAATRIAETSHYFGLQKALHEMENSRQQIISLRRVFATQKIHLEQQQEIVVLSLESYAIKQTSMQDLLTSKNRLIDAKNALMITTNILGTANRRFAWQLGFPFPTPAVDPITP